MRQRRTFPDLRRRAGTRGYSIAETVIAMALVVLFSVAGFLACYVGLRMQENAASSIRIWNAADEVRGAFERTLSEQGGVSDDEAEKNSFLLAFQERLAFALDSWTPNVFGFTGIYALDREPWELQLAMETETVWTAEPGADGGASEPVEREVAVVGLDTYYYGAVNGQPSYRFDYRYFTRSYEILAKVNVRTGVYYLTVEGYQSGMQSPSYTLEEVYG